MPITHKACLPLVRLGEPSFLVKANCQFDIPASHLSPRYKDIGDEVLERVHNEMAHKLPVKPIKYPDLAFIKRFDKHVTFSTFDPKHFRYANALIKLFDDAKDLDELISTALYVRDQINKQLFVYAYYVVLTHRYDTDNIQLPQYFEIAPHQFFKKSVFHEVNKKYQNSNSMFTTEASSSSSTNRVTRQTNTTQEPVEIPFRRTMSLSNPEGKLTFFREDIGINSHHFHWHVVYPFNGPASKFYDKDRRGEIFYYMHHQLLNIYHLNRLALGVASVEPFENFREPIKEGYFPNLTTSTSSFDIAPRQNNVQLRDLHRFGDNTKVGDIERWYQRLQDVIDNGFCLNKDGEKVNLLDDSGINTFTNLMESNVLSLNRTYYGDLHNAGHRLFSAAHDPNLKYLEPYAVMGDNSTAVRDPVFFRWHQALDDLCVKLKNRLPKYTNDQLSFNGIKIQSLDLLNANNETLPNNEFITYWQKSTVNLQHGLDFRVQHPILVQFTHLNYQHFSYSLRVNNSNATAVQGTIRIFLVPMLDEKRLEYSFDDGRVKVFELDRFVSNFLPGSNRVVRQSTDSSLTISYDRTFPMQLDGNVLLSDQPDDVQAFCQCGWPQHMLLPKGTIDGYPFRLFAMISDYNDDKIVQPPSNGVCNDNYVLCGLRNRKYPDKRSMGFPFDRPASRKVNSFMDFSNGYDNMIWKAVSIRHLSENTAQIGDDSNNIVKL